MAKKYFVEIEQDIYYNEKEDKVLITEPVESTLEEEIHTMLGIEEIDGVQRVVLSALNSAQYMENTGSNLNLPVPKDEDI